MGFKENLSRIRLERDFSKREMAQILNIPYTTYVNYESIGNEPPYKTLKKIAALFGVSLENLLEDYNPEASKAVNFTELPVQESLAFTPKYIITRYGNSRLQNIFDEYDSELIDIHKKALKTAQQTYEDAFLREFLHIVSNEDDREIETLKQTIRDLEERLAAKGEFDICEIDLPSDKKEE